MRRARRFPTMQLRAAPTSGGGLVLYFFYWPAAANKKSCSSSCSIRSGAAPSCIPRLIRDTPLLHPYPLRGCNSDLAQYSNTPTFRAAGFEDDEDSLPDEALPSSVGSSVSERSRENEARLLEGSRFVRLQFYKLIAGCSRKLPRTCWYYGVQIAIVALSQRHT